MLRWTGSMRVLSAVYACTKPTGIMWCSTYIKPSLSVGRTGCSSPATQGECKMILTNDFHQTTTTVRAKKGDYLSPAQVKRIKRRLCPWHDCTCSGALGLRGPQPEKSNLFFASCGVRDWHDRPIFYRGGDGYIVLGAHIGQYPYTI